MLEEQNGLRDGHVDLLQLALPVLLLDLLDDRDVLRRDVFEFRFDEVVEINQRNEVCLLAGLHPLLQKAVDEGQNGPCRPREDRLGGIAGLLPEVRENLEEERRLIRQERVEVQESLAVDVVQRRFGVLLDARIHEQRFWLVAGAFENAFRCLSTVLGLLEQPLGRNLPDVSAG